MKEYSFFLPQNITVGAGCIRKLPEKLKDLGSKKAFVISGPTLLRHGVVSKIEGLLVQAGFEIDHFTEIEPNPSVETVEAAVKAFLESGADSILALGGGSPMDVAKAVAVVAKFGGKVTDYEGAHKVPGKIIPMIAIPTTAGTGSEVTAFSVITDHSRDYKFTIFSYELLPQYALLDPELITTLPEGAAAACGMDAWIHAMEAYLSLDANAFSEAMSEKAMELIGGSIVDYVKDRRNLTAAENMLVGSLFAGIAFSFARLGDVHAMSHPISAVYDVPHGVANAVLLPAVTEFNAAADHGKYARIYGYLKKKPEGNSKEEESFAPQMLVDRIRSLSRELGIPERILEAVHRVPGQEQVTREQILERIPSMAEDAMKSGNIAVNPRQTSMEDVLGIYENSL